MKKDRRTPGPNSAERRRGPRDADQAAKPFLSRAGFLSHLRATNRPTSKDLRDLRALKRTGPQLEGPLLDPAANPDPEPPGAGVARRGPRP